MNDTKKKPPLDKVLTGKGIAKFPYLNAPDTKFNADGEFRIRLVIADDSNQQSGSTKGKSIKAMLEEAAQKKYEETKAQLEESFNTEKGEKKAKAKKALDALKVADLPIKPVYDDEGNETGEIELSFKMKHKRTDKKTQKTIEQFPKLFDAAGHEFPRKTPIWGGSEVKVAAQVVPFYTAAVGAGASLRLSAVQIIKLNTSGGGDAGSYGFGSEEGYNVPDGMDDEPTTPAESSGDDGGGEDF